MTDHRLRKFDCPSCGREVVVSAHALSYECPFTDCRVEAPTPWAGGDEEDLDELLEMFG